MSLPRMVTWAVFEDRKTHKRFTYYNTHFAHRGQQDDDARRRAALIIAARIPKDGAFLLTGDFNAAAGEATSYKILAAPLKDAWLVADKKSGPEGTFHGFKGTPGKARIDWILYRGKLKFKTAGILTMNENGLYPSDHFPVVAAFSVR